MSIAIKVENLSKAYQLGEIGTGTISRDLERWFAKIRGKEDPFLKIGETNDRLTKGSSDVVWSLKDINFEIQQGDAVGIIGRNGAGKSTLLKILSRVTAPTSGKIKLKGRIASLLEVGTGFHPELTGKENIFLNGAILGMRKKEIARKFDEIVDFAGVERYINTPVKRYSSGMYVRLAFAVAAHLDSEILIVDEVLAVGDAEFQKKCLGKMGEMSKGEGLTVLFVSHQMDAISRLCSNAILLKNGLVNFDGDVNTATRLYLNKNAESNASVIWEENVPGNNIVKLLRVSILNQSGLETENFNIQEPIAVSLLYEVLIDNVRLTPGINVFNENGNYLFTSHDIKNATSRREYAKGKYESKVSIPGNFLAEGLFNISVAIMSYEPFTVHIHEKDILSFNVLDEVTGNSARGMYAGQFPGLVRPLLEWNTKKFGLIDYECN